MAKIITKTIQLDEFVPQSRDTICMESVNQKMKFLIKNGIDNIDISLLNSPDWQIEFISDTQIRIRKNL